MNQVAIIYLEETQDPAGGWSFTQGGTPGVEPTALAILALRGLDEAKSIRRRAQDWLVSIQHEDGGWGLNGLDTRSGWHTAWGIIGLKDMISDTSALKRGQKWLLNIPIVREDNLDILQAYNQDMNMDITLVGWPWAPLEASWVLPTALAMLALRENLPLPEVQTRLIEAVRYLENRHIPGGGWNVGNPVMFEGVLPAHTIPTALSLIALKSLAPDNIQPVDIDVLTQKAKEDGGAKALGWALLSLRMLDKDSSDLRALLVAAQRLDGSWESNPYSTAIALLGLRGEL